jgi:hypothetical protein
MSSSPFAHMTGAERLAVAARLGEEHKARAERRLRRYRPTITLDQIRAMRIRHAQWDSAWEMAINERIRRGTSS